LESYFIFRYLLSRGFSPFSCHDRSISDLSVPDKQRRFRLNAIKSKKRVKNNKYLLFESKALWIHDYEISAMSYDERFTIRHFSSVPPLSKHDGFIRLSETEIVLEGDEDRIIPLASVTELYHGFDELYPASSVKNFGAFWKPLRIKHGYGNCTYFILNHGLFGTSNAHFLDLLKDLLS